LFWYYNPLKRFAPRYASTVSLHRRFQKNQPCI
jgi:hypothetical protein